MIDIHNHLLFGVDDGSKTIIESISVIQGLSEVGVTDIILTPHYINYTSHSNDKESNEKILSILRKKLEEDNINVNLYLGNEIYIDSEIIRLLKDGKISTLNNSKYILIELPMSGVYDSYMDIFLDLINIGYNVILAHPERYIAFQRDFEKLYELKEIGVLFQCNIGSILGQYGKRSCKLLKKLLKSEMVEFLATDIHHKKEDYSFIQKASKKIKRIVKEEKLNDLLINNAKEIIK